MFYFIYDHGNFLVIREFNDSSDAEVVDRIPFYDVKKINYWCKFANLKFPYEVNIIEKLDIQMLFILFDGNVKNGNITLFTE